MGITNNPAFSASRNNLFGFRPPSVKLAAKHPDQTRKDLAALGLSEVYLFASAIQNTGR